MAEARKISPIGVLKNINLEALKAWRVSRTSDEVRTEYWTNWGYHLQEKYSGTDLMTYLNHKGIMDNPSYFWSDSEDERLKRFNDFISSELSKLKEVLEYSKEFNNPLYVYISDEKFSLIGWGKIRQILPTECLEISLHETFDEVPLSQIPMLMGIVSNNENENESTDGSSAVKTIDGVDISNVTRKELQTSISELQADLEAQEKKTKDEIEVLREELRKREDGLRLQMREKMAELRAKKKEFEVQLFGLDHQLYLLRCLLGDSVELTQLRSGEAAPIEQPVVLFQKLRFLDEDLAKMKVIYGFNCDNEKYIEKVFAKDDLAFETFCPNTKCVTLFRISKDKTYWARTDGNLLERFEYYNGNRVAILLRNGENLWLAWTDQDRIYIKENFVYQAKASSQLDESSSIDTSEIITNDNYMSDREVALVQFFSRKFLMAILQGFIEYKRIFEFPEKVSFYGPGKYIIFSTADNQIVDRRYGTLSQFMKKMNPLTEVGDMILPIQRISGSVYEKSWSGNDYYENHERGRGDRNRVRGCDIKDEVQRINLIDIPKDESILADFSNSAATCENVERKQDLLKRTEEFFKIDKELAELGKDRMSVGDTVYTRIYDCAGRGYVWKENGKKYRSIKIKKEVFFVEKRDEYKYYVSVEKPEEWNSNRSGKVRVCSNVQIELDEMINVSYLSSSILTYFLETKQIGPYFGKNYAYAVEYLHKALVFVKNRENEEIILINRLACKDISKIQNIDVILACWKFANGVKTLTERKAKKFVQYLNTIKDFEAEYKAITSQLPWVSQ